MQATRLAGAPISKWRETTLSIGNVSKTDCSGTSLNFAISSWPVVTTMIIAPVPRRSEKEKAGKTARRKKRQGQGEEKGRGRERRLEAGDVYLQLKVGAADCTPISRGRFPKKRNVVSVRKMELIGPLERRGRFVANKTTSERMKSKPRRWMTYGGGEGDRGWGTEEDEEQRSCSIWNSRARRRVCTVRCRLAKDSWRTREIKGSHSFFRGNANEKLEHGDTLLTSRNRASPADFRRILQLLGLKIPAGGGVAAEEKETRTRLLG